MKKYKLVGEVKEQVIELMDKPVAGIPCSFSSFKDSITYKKKFFCIMYAMPTSGKSEFVLQECIYLSKRYGWKHILFTPEMGDSEDIISLLIHKCLGKSVSPIKGVEQADIDEVLTVMKWLNNHFILVDTDEGISLEEIIDIVDKVKEEHNWVADNIVIDNHNDLNNVLDPNGRQDLQIEKQLTYLRRQLKKRDMYAFLVTHTSDMKAPLTEKGITYYPIPDPSKMRGGAALYRKGYLILNIWRCPYGLLDQDGNPYSQNQSIITVQKAKPTHTGIKGYQGNIWWDYKKSKFTDQPPIIRINERTTN